MEVEEEGSGPPKNFGIAPSMQRCCR